MLSYILRKANKRHICTDCERPILPNEYYLQGSSIRGEKLCWWSADFEIPADSIGLETERRECEVK